MVTKIEQTEQEQLALATYIKLARAAESVSHTINDHLYADGLTVSQFGVLEALYHLGPMSVGQLGEKILRSSGNMTMVVDNLVKRDLVVRERRQDDRRRVEVRMSDRGRQLMERIWTGHLAGVVAAFDVLSAGEQEQLGNLCRKLGIAQSDIRVK